MEKTVVASYINEKVVLDKHEIFLYKCIERKNIGRKVIVTFTRDESLPYINDIKKLEEQYPNYMVGTMLPTLICPVISFGLLTAFLVVFFLTKPEFNLPLFFSALMIPAILLLVVSVIFMILRVKKLSKIEKEKPIIDKEFREKVNQIVSKH